MIFGLKDKPISLTRLSPGSRKNSGAIRLSKIVAVGRLAVLFLQKAFTKKADKYRAEGQKQLEIRDSDSDN